MKFYIIGIDDNSEPRFSAEVEQIISRGMIFSGGVRHHQIVERWLPDGAQWIDITPPMGSLFERYESCEEVVVFASGDPLFYGFAQTIQRYVRDAEMVTYPHFNSLQQLAHKLTQPYQDMRVVSLTGRPWHKFDEALIVGEEMIGVLTDNRDHTPRNIARRMLQYGFTNYVIAVGELLGNVEGERVRRLSVEEVASEEFAYPNNMILQRVEPKGRRFGIPDGEFALLDGRERMITKMAIRLVTLSQLDLRCRKSFWDVGFCTGSVSVEAKQQFAHLQINSFEIREGCDKIIEENMRRHSTPGIEYHIGDFCKADLTTIPDPDAVFIGGHGGHLREIMRRVTKRLSNGGVVVINSVSESSYNDFMEAAAECSLAVEGEMQLSVDSYNKITIIKAVKR